MPTIEEVEDDDAHPRVGGAARSAASNAVDADRDDVNHADATADDDGGGDDDDDAAPAQAVAGDPSFDPLLSAAQSDPDFLQLFQVAAQLKAAQPSEVARRARFDALPAHVRNSLAYRTPDDVAMRDARAVHLSDRIRYAEALKERGNQLFAAKQHAAAGELYERALAIFRYAKRKGKSKAANATASKLTPKPDAIPNANASANTADSKSAPAAAAAAAVDLSASDASDASEGPDFVEVDTASDVLHGNDADARDCLTALLAGLYANVALVALQHKPTPRYRDVISAAEAALLLDPTHAKALYRCALGYAGVDDLDRALFVMRKAAAAAPNDPEVNRRLTLLLERDAKDRATARRAFGGVFAATSGGGRGPTAAAAGATTAGAAATSTGAAAGLYDDVPAAATPSSSDSSSRSASAAASASAPASTSTSTGRGDDAGTRAFLEAYNAAFRTVRGTVPGRGGDALGNTEPGGNGTRRGTGTGTGTGTGPRSGSGGDAVGKMAEAAKRFGVDLTDVRVQRELKRLQRDALQREGFAVPDGDDWERDDDQAQRELRARRRAAAEAKDEATARRANSGGGGIGKWAVIGIVVVLFVVRVWSLVRHWAAADAAAHRSAVRGSGAGSGAAATTAGTRTPTAPPM